MSLLLKIRGSISTSATFMSKCYYCTTNSFVEKLEPDYLTDKTPKPVELPLVNVQLRGRDYALLQEHQKWVDKCARKMGLSVTQRWASPAECTDISRVSPGATKPDEVFHLKTYTRTVQLKKLPSYKIPVLLEVLQSALPQGVKLSVDLHSEQIEKERYVPDLELRDLRLELEELEQM